jgi:hypothetical protein
MSGNTVSLVGMYFVESDAGHTTYRLGQVIGELADGYHLITFMVTPGADEARIAMPIEVVHLIDFNSQCPSCKERLWDFFFTEEARDKYVAFNTKTVTSPADSGATTKHGLH